MSVVFTYSGGSLTVGGGGSNPYPRYSISNAPNADNRVNEVAKGNLYEVEGKEWGG